MASVKEGMAVQGSAIRFITEGKSVVANRVEQWLSILSQRQKDNAWSMKTSAALSGPLPHKVSCLG